MSSTPTFDPADIHLRTDEANAPSDVESSPSTTVSRASGTRFLDASQSSSPEERKQATSRTHLTTRFLRKSASADSCVAQRSPTPSASGADSLRDDASSGINEPEPHSPQGDRTDARVLSSPPSVMSLSGYLRSKVSRRRGASNANATDNEISGQEESDLDRSTNASGTVKGRVRARLLSLKGSKASGPTSDACDAPPRLPVRNTSANVSNTKTTQPHPAASKLSRKSTMAPMVPEQPAEKKEATRARSHSVGPPSRNSMSRAAKRFSFGNQTPRVSLFLLLFSRAE